MAKVEFAEAINRQMGIPIKQVIDNYETFGTELFDTADAQTGLQSLRKAMESGMYTVNLASAASDYLFFGRGDIDSIREMALNPPYVDKNQGPLVRIGQALLQNAPLQVSNRLKGLTLGFAAGGGAALSTYLATSPVTGAIPGPLDEFIAAGGAFSMAFAPAYKAATAIETAKSQAGLTFANLISMKAKDSEGNDVYIKESHAKWLAAGLGGISGLLEFLQTEQLISGFPGVKNILTGKVANTITRTINSNRFASFAGRFLKNYTLTMGTETLQEVAQESIDIFAENLAAEISGKRRRTVDE